jgi:hypothetical protein
MKKSEVKLGDTYRAKVSGRVVDEEPDYGAWAIVIPSGGGLCRR